MFVFQKKMLSEKWRTYNANGPPQPVAKTKRKAIDLVHAPPVQSQAERDADAAANGAAIKMLAAQGSEDAAAFMAARALKKERVDTEAATDPVAHASSPPAVRVKVELPQVVDEEQKIMTLEAHNRRDMQHELFEHNVSQILAPNAATLHIAPPRVDPLEFCLRFPAIFPWAPAYVDGVAADASITFQEAPILSRSYISDFLREPSPQNKLERACVNLDRLPMQHEQGLERCAAHELSTRLLGEGRGFRLREMLFNHQDERDGGINEYAMMQDMCFMCHLRLTNRKCLAQRNNKKRRERKDLTSAVLAEVAMESVANRFQVIVGVEGEYCMDQIISHSGPAVMLCGPFPRWVPNNFATTVLNGSNLRGFVESDKVVFRLARMLPGQSACKTHGATACTRCSHTSAPPTGTAFSRK